MHASPAPNYHQAHLPPTRHGQQFAPVLGLGEWIVTMLILAIPLVGFVMLFVWAFDSNGNPNRANWAKAILVWMLISVGGAILMWSTLAAMFLSVASGLR